MMVTIRPLTSTDIPATLRVWQDTVGRTQDVDTPEQLALMLDRNPGVCQVAEYQGHIIGLTVAGHDGRRGTLHYVGVALAYRRNGIGRKLVEVSFDVLRQQGQNRVHVQFKESNATALRFWKSLGMRERNDLVVISLQL
jgi:N-acetylglutamate synthase